MVQISDVLNSTVLPQFYTDYLQGKRQLTSLEIEVLKQCNKNSDPTWKNVWVDEKCFDASLISCCEINGFLVIGRLSDVSLKYHDLSLKEGLYSSYLENVVIGDDCVVRNVKYLSNYKIGDRNILFNIQEMSCTNHSKFGNGILKNGEPESNRVWISVGNENDGRAVLAFEKMIPADAFIWAKYRGNKELQERLVEITESQFPKELNTYGLTGNDVVIKNSTLLKDAKICDCTYIKGAFKLKNITILSTSDEPSQIGEGVELVNGIMNPGSKAFYQAVAVRFVIGRNCQLKYGARLLNSVLGDNSTVSCCEILNNLIFPFHEQHHNSSFLIASMIGGQSNIASGATIGSNHNSRAADGEMYAGRGFWPGLCSDFKHNSRFANFTLISKGSYQNELNIIYPFSLVASNGPCQPVTIIPAYWFMYNMYAIARNKSKFAKRDKRLVKEQNIEIDPIAPDSIQEVEVALRRIIELTGKYLVELKNEEALAAATKSELYQVAKDFLHQNPNASFTLSDKKAQKKFGAIVIKPVKAYKAYRRIVKFFAVRTLNDYCIQSGKDSLSFEDIRKISDMPLFTEWVNVGGQIIPSVRLEQLFERITGGQINSWEQIHEYYNGCQAQYENYKVAYALNLLEKLYSRPVSEFTPEIYDDIVKDVLTTSKDFFEATLVSRMKDFDDEFRMQTFDDAREMTAVLGGFSENEFILDMQERKKAFEANVVKIFETLKEELINS